MYFDLANFSNIVYSDHLLADKKDKELELLF